MKYFSNNKNLFILLVLSYCLIFPPKAYAYLDPGTGSFVVQIIIASAVGIGFSIKMFWGNLKLFFNSLFAGKKIGTELIEEEKIEEENDGVSKIQ